MALEDFYNKINALVEFDIEKEVADIINEHSEFLSDMLKRQLALGRDGAGNEKTLIRKGRKYDYYAKSTIENKRQFGLGLGAVTDRITHSFSGEFYQSLHVKAEGQFFEFFSEVSYFKDILATSGSGSKIMELDQESLDLFSQNILIPELQIRFNQKFNGL